MFNNPIKKYQSGGKATPQQEQQIAQLFEAASKNTGIDVETLMNAANQMPDENSMKQYVQAISMAAQGDQSAISSIKKMFSQKPTMQKLGGKILAFICKHAKGGQIADCGCGSKVPKAEMGLPLKEYSFFEKQWTPDGKAVYTIAKRRNDLPSNMASDPFSEYSQNGGEYLGNGQIQVVDYGDGTNRVNLEPFGPVEVVAHGSDSASVVNHLRSKLAEAKVKPTSGIMPRKEKGGVVKGQKSIPGGMPEIPEENKIYSEKNTMVKGPSIGQRRLGVRRPWLAQTISFNPFSAQNDTSYTGRNLEAFIPGYSDDLLKIRYSALPPAVKKNLAKAIDSDYEEYNSTYGSYPNNYYEKTITVKKRK